MARPDLLVHTFDLKNESLLMSQTNRKNLDKKFKKLLDRIHKKGDKRLDHIEHVKNNENKEKRKDDMQGVKNKEKLLGS